MRHQCLDIQGKTSSILETGARGVVQGGSSSGDLFLIYLNNIPECRPRDDQEKPSVWASQFVDDINLVVHSKTEASLQSALQASFSNIEEDLLNHRMIINSDKTQMMIITRNVRLKKITITAGKQIISHQENLKTLGINLSSNGKYDKHIIEDKNSLIK